MTDASHDLLTPSERLRREAGRMRRAVKSRLWNARHGGDHSRLSWSQEAEDLVLDKYFGHRARGFYVDVGAHHPTRFSNTRLFYLRGWRGINIDAMPGSMKAFERDRPRDINLNIGIAANGGALTYYQYDEPALNGFVRGSETIASNRAKGAYRLLGTQTVEVAPLASVLERHLSHGQVIDFLSVDVEGLDLEVLKSNDWARFRPECVVVELDGLRLEEALEDECCVFLRELDYRLYARTGKSTIFCAG
jgi:FkbM family methyltransferase